jgi:hypothetical protein
MQELYIDTDLGEQIVSFSIKSYPPKIGANKWSGAVIDDNTIVISFIEYNGEITSIKKSSNIITGDIVLYERLCSIVENHKALTNSDFEDTESFINKEDVIDDPYNPDDIKVRKDVYSIPELFHKINKKDIDLFPDFQRHLVWDKTKKSRLIESIMLGIPLPVFYFAEDKDGIFYVVDGLQRLSTIRDFLLNKFYLTNLEHFHGTCNRKYFGISEGVNDRVVDKNELKENTALDRRFQRRIENAQLNVNVIESSSPAKVKYDIFKRINEGGKPLNQQEIRNSLAKTHTRQLLIELSKQEAFTSATGGINDMRMGAQEMVLRFIGFYLSRKKNKTSLNYKGDMNEFLDRVNEEVNRMKSNEIDAIKNIFTKTMQSANHLFGKYSFRKYTVEQLDSEKKQLLNKALFVTWSVVLSEYDTTVLKSKFQFEEFAIILSKELSKNEDYFNGVSHRSSDRFILEKSFEFAENLIKKYLI